MDLSIIIVNWNSADFLRACLDSVFRDTSDITMEVIIVDNASYDGSQEMIRRDFPPVRYIQSDANLGFARANNLGYQSSTGRLLLFLNPDTVILGSALSQMTACLDSLPDAGAAGCRLLNGDGTLQTSCVQALPTILNQALDAEALRKRFPNSRLWGMAPLFHGGSAPQPIEMISGAALMVRRDVFERIGMFSTEYFMYGEDAELCHKIAAAGWKLYYLPAAQIIHYGGQSTKKEEGSFSTLLMQESLSQYFARTHSSLHAILFRCSRFFTALVRLGALTVMRILPANDEARAGRRSSFRKWALLLRWSLGLAKWNQTGNAKAGSGTASAKKTEAESRTKIGAA
jgi:N-acetylglucosaminyl-diphospho-decaprenol L-rhamnosyltransferase